MAISKGNTQGREACCFTLAAEQYEEQRMECIVYEGNQEQGIRCRSFPGLAHAMEQGIETMNYPMPSVQIRKFSNGRTGKTDENQSGGSVVSERHSGSLGTFRIWIKQCLHATWQGQICREEDEQELIPFHSFLDLVYILDAMFSGRQPAAKTEGESLAASLGDALFMAGRNSGIRIGEQDSLEVLICGRHLGDGSKETFAIRPMFRENHTFQGILCWSEGRQQKIFRSFLELLFLMVSTTGKWE